MKPILIYHWHRLIKYLKTLMLIGNISEQRDLNLMTFVAVPSDFVFPLKFLSQEFLFHFLSLTFLILRILHSCHRNVSFLSQTSYKLQGTLFPKPGECLSCHFSVLPLQVHIFGFYLPKSPHMMHLSFIFTDFHGAFFVHYSALSVSCLQTCPWWLCLYEQVMFL